jgi:hypothetical protein
VTGAYLIACLVIAYRTIRQRDIGRQMVRSQMMGSGIRGVLTAITSVTLFGCGSSPITSTRIEAAIETTFANLVELQVSRLRLPPMTAPDFAVTAICRKQVAGAGAGAGDWACTLVWQGPDRRTLRDSYDLIVTTEGCYTATVAGESLGGPTLKASDGSVVGNLLYAFEGCFDTT